MSLRSVLMTSSMSRSTFFTLRLRSSGSCASVSPRLNEAFTRAARDGREELYALAHCAQLCEQLIAGGAQDLHFYTLNRPDLTRDVVRALGITPAPALEKVA
jgi:methylenetetrahydrofolate reductase (NADPH)